MAEKTKKKVGRKKNLPNRYNRELLERFRAVGFDPAEELKALYFEAKSQYEESERAVAEIEKADEEGREVKFPIPFDSKNTIKLRGAAHLRLAGDLLGEIMKYTYPKLANVEHKISNPDAKPAVQIYLPDNGRQAPAEFKPAIEVESEDVSES